MPFYQPDQVRYFSFESLAGFPLDQAVFTRQGGTSPAPWASLNMGGTVGDDPERVQQNKEQALHVFQRNPSSVFDVFQVHSADVVFSDVPRPPSIPHQKADIILTDRPGLTLMMRFADCVPILLFDPAQKVVGLVHAGWVGTLKKAVTVAVEAMQTRYHCQPHDILAAIGPSIGPDHYEVGEDVVTQVRQVFGTQSSDLLPGVNGHVHFDLWKANRLLLEMAGVRQIEVAGVCTACHVEDWFSHRAEHGKTGRFGALVGLKG